MSTLPQILSGFTGTSGSPTAATINPTMVAMGGFVGTGATTPEQLMAAINANYQRQGSGTRITLQQAQGMIQSNPQAYNQPAAAPSAASLGYQAPSQTTPAPRPITTQPVAPAASTQSLGTHPSSMGDGAASTPPPPGTAPPMGGAFTQGTYSPFGQDPTANYQLQA